MTLPEPIDLDRDPSVATLLADRIFTRAAELDADEVRVDPGERELTITWRRDGEVAEALEAPAPLRPGLTAKLKKLGGLDVGERRRPQRGELRLSDGRSYVIATIPVRGGEQVVIVRGQP